MVNRVLLTGAGFSNNFGAPLAKEMANHIFNNSKLDKYPNLKELLRNNFDYEAIYYKVMSASDNEYPQEEKVALTEAISDSYTYIWQCFNKDMGQTKHKCFDSILKKITNEDKGSGYIFTLNQDLFIEKYWDNYPELNQLNVPGARASLGNNIDINIPVIIDASENNITAYKQDFYQKEQKKNATFYIKLHGSQNWESDDGKSMMVIGYNKEERIQANTLLAWYFEIFKNVLAGKDTKLMVIGYSFNDTHVNKIIADSKCKIYVIDPISMADFIKGLEKKPNGKKIATLLEGYYAVKITDLFPAESSKKFLPMWTDIEATFFNQ